MDSSTSAGVALRRLADAIDARDWSGLGALLATDFVCLYPHTQESFDRDQYVALNRDYPGVWRFVYEGIVDAGATGALRATVSDSMSVDGETHFVAAFGTVDDGGLLVELVEIWAEKGPPPEGDRRPHSAVRSPT